MFTRRFMLDRHLLSLSMMHIVVFLEIKKQSCYLSMLVSKDSLHLCHCRGRKRNIDFSEQENFEHKLLNKNFTNRIPKSGKTA